MKTNAKQLPQRILAIGNMQHHINYSVTTGVDEDGNPDYNYETAHVNGEPTYDLLVKSIIADKYSESKEIALLNNYNADKNVQEYVDYQQFRELAKWIASEDRLLTVDEVDLYNQSLKKIKVTLPISKVVVGGVYANLSDLLLKTRAVHTTIGNNIVVYLSYILPEHLAIFEADNAVTIE